MRKGSLAGLAFLAGSLSAHPVISQEVDVLGTVTGGLQFGSGGAGLSTSVAVRARSETRVSAVTASGSASMALSDGDTDFSLSGRLQATRTLKRGQIFAEASYASTPSTFEEVTEDFTLDLVEGTRFSTGLAAGMRYELSPRLSSSTRLFYSGLDYDPVNVEQVPSDEYGASLSLSYAADTRTSLTGSVGLSWFTSENAISTESLSASATIGGTRAINNTTRANGSIGLSFINTEEEVGAVRVAEWSTALLLDAGLARDYADGTMNIGVSQNVSPTAAGDLALNTALNAGLSYDLNRRTQVAVEGSIGRQSEIGGGGDATTVLSVSPSFAVEIVEGLDATARYTLRNTDSGTSHRFGLGLSRDFGNASP